MTFENFRHPRPKVVHVCAVAPDIIELQIQERVIIPSEQYPYFPEPDDEIREQELKGRTGRQLIRNGGPAGWLADAGGEDAMVFCEQQVLGEALDGEAADRKDSYRLRDISAERVGEWYAPVDVYRKSQVNGLAITDRERPAILHHMYLSLPRPLSRGASLEVKLAGLTANPHRVIYHHEPEQVRSEAVHCTHMGFRPDDTAKSAYLACWMGTGGGVAYPDQMTFALVDDATGERCYEGRIGWCWPENKPEKLARGTNYNHCDVWRMDFSDFERTGTWRVVVDGVGSSYPFRIDEAVWEESFRLAMRGIYHQRSGMPMGLPYATYHAPRSFRPEDGMQIYHSDLPNLHCSNGLDAEPTGFEACVDFSRLEKHVTDAIVEDAWGGYMDAGDWDRRIKHLGASFLQLELMLLFPDYYKQQNLNIPESISLLPDIIEEVCWGIDVYRRMQREDGAIRGGIESTEHPKFWECSWQESNRVFAYAPDLWSSYIYAGVGARLARVLQSSPGEEASERAGIYAESATKAMEWAESEHERIRASGDLEAYEDYVQIHIREERSLAAVEMFALSGDEKWHGVFSESEDFDEHHEALSLYYRRASLDAAFAYLLVEENKTNESLQEKCRAFTLMAAGRTLDDARGNAWSKEHGYRPSVGFSGGLRELEGPAHGHFSIPVSATLLRGYHLTGDEKMLNCALRSAQFVSGGNPLNRAMMTGMGYNPPRFIQHCDTQKTGQLPPEGITVMGFFDSLFYKDHPIKSLSWAPTYLLDASCTPSVYDFPIGESYFDLGCWLANTEFTVHHTLGPTSYAYGYLAARGRKAPRRRNG